MKYLTFTPNGGFPFAVLFSGHIKHTTIATLIAQPVQGAGFVTIPDAVAFPGGFSTSLNAGVSTYDRDLIQGGLSATADAYPPPPTHITPAQRLAAILTAVTQAESASRKGAHPNLVLSALEARIHQVLNKPSA